MILPKAVNSGTKVLYSINGEGVYTGSEVAERLGAPVNYGISWYAAHGYKGVAVAYRKAYIVQYGGKKFKFKSLQEAGKKLKCSPPTVKNMAKDGIIKLEERWEKENETGRCR